MTQSASPPYSDIQGSGPGYIQFSQQGYGDQLHTGPVTYAQQQYQVQPGAIATQPTVYVSQGPLNPPVNDHLAYSILTMLFCLPLGIIALIYSVSARQANLSGNRPQAEQASRTARTLSNLALGIGLLVILFVLLYFLSVLIAPPFL